MSQGDFSILFQRPISATVLVIAACLFVMFVFLQLRGKQQTKLRTGQIEV
jgi:TctA family transporter